MFFLDDFIDYGSSDNVRKKLLDLELEKKWRTFSSRYLS